jgi:hypothetical protein
MDWEMPCMRGMEHLCGSEIGKEEDDNWYFVGFSTIQFGFCIESHFDE